MDPSTTLVNGQPVPKVVKELATDDAGGVNTAVVKFLHDDYVRSSESDTLIRKPLVDHEADTVIEPPPEMD